MRHKSMAETGSMTTLLTVAAVTRNNAWSWEHGRSWSRIWRGTRLRRRFGHGRVLQMAFVALIRRLPKVSVGVRKRLTRREGWATDSVGYERSSMIAASLARPPFWTVISRASHTPSVRRYTSNRLRCRCVFLRVNVHFITGVLRGRVRLVIVLGRSRQASACRSSSMGRSIAVVDGHCNRLLDVCCLARCPGEREVSLLVCSSEQLKRVETI